jgi:membrane associated rhomboid family serine protease
MGETEKHTNHRRSIKEDSQAMLVPLRTDEPTRRPSIVTILLISANVAVFVYQQLSFRIHGVDLASVYGAVPTELFRGVKPPLPAYLPYLSLLTYMFLHGGFVHVIGNMLFLNTFGPNIEDIMGHFKFLLFYILCGLVSAIVYILPNFREALPLVGASGAIAGVMGAHLRALPGTQTTFPCFWRDVWDTSTEGQIRIAFGQMTR